MGLRPGPQQTHGRLARCAFIASGREEQAQRGRAASASSFNQSSHRLVLIFTVRALVKQNSASLCKGTVSLSLT